MLIALSGGLAACQSAPEPGFVWACPDGADFGLRYAEDGKALIWHNGHVYSLSPAISASGARYQGDGYEFWEHHGEARIIDGAGAVHEGCRTR